MLNKLLFNPIPSASLPQKSHRIPHTTQHTRTNQRTTISLRRKLNQWHKRHQTTNTIQQSLNTKEIVLEGTKKIPRFEYLYGVGMGVGLHVSGMVLPQKIWNFFNVANLETFDPSLLVVFMSALAVHAALYYGVAMRRGRPVLDTEFHLPSNKGVDMKLVLGAGLFGLGWAVSGFCPGPGIASIGRLEIGPVLFASSAFTGFIVKELLFEKAQIKDFMNAKVGLLAAFFAGFAMLAGMSPDQFPVAPVEFNLFTSMIGGSIIGTAVASKMIFHGKVLGNSGLLSGLIKPGVPNYADRFLFLLGLISASAVMQMVYPLPIGETHGVIYTLVGGLLVGIGTSLGNGCTSGHGIAGITRLSPRSIVATSIFFAVCMGVTSLLYKFVF
eukprot:TRINITY_DN5875_c0_g1_i1.p1 TRINITY_DN5875_c0_g1~~TRINITY_DN5875_c0_g1_i1.p1  ORF type:complete len:394 (-),score=61.01 TRINITY_DN5875_c0_g1_i1:16-1167(-)